MRGVLSEVRGVYTPLGGPYNILDGFAVLTGRKKSREYLL